MCTTAQRDKYRLFILETKPILPQHIYALMYRRQFTSCLCDRPIYFPFLGGAVSPVASQCMHCCSGTAITLQLFQHTHTHIHTHSKHIHASTPPFPKATRTCMSRLLPVLITLRASALSASPVPQRTWPLSISVTTLPLCLAIADTPSNTGLQAPQRLRD